MRPALNGGVSLERPAPRRCGRDAERRRHCGLFFPDAGAARGPRGCCSYSAFVGVAAPPRPSLRSALAEQLPALAAAVAGGLAAGGVAGGVAGAGAGALGLQAACMPLWAPSWTRRVGQEGAEASEFPVPLHIRILQGTLVSACATQALVATMQFFISDPVNGLIGCSIATLGMQAASTHGYRFLPSYIVLTFCNGSMQLLLGLAYPNIRNVVWDLARGSAALKAAGVITLTSPGIMFLGLAIAWKLHSALVNLASDPPRAVQGEEGDLAAGEAASRPSGSWQPFSGPGHRLPAAAK